MSLPAGRILAIDPGGVRIGLAVSGPLGVVAQPLPTLQSGGRKKDFDALQALVEERGIAEIVIGCPLNMDGSRGQMTEFAERLADDLRDRMGIHVTLWDERLSSVQAERALIHGDVRREDRRQLRDRVAAVLILQGFLDWRSLELST